MIETFLGKLLNAGSYVLGTAAVLRLNGTKYAPKSVSSRGIDGKGPRAMNSKQYIGAVYFPDDSRAACSLGGNLCTVADYPNSLPHLSAAVIVFKGNRIDLHPGMEPVPIGDTRATAQYTNKSFDELDR